MIYKVTARLPGGSLSVEVEGESRYQCLSLAQHYFRRAFCEDLADNEKDYKGYRNRWANTLDELVSAICTCLHKTPQEANDRRN